MEIDPETEVIPAIGAKECIYNLCFAFLDPGDVALASDPGYPVYTGGPLLAGAETVLLPLVPELGFAPDLDALAADDLARARLMFINYPNNPTGAVAPDGFFEQVVELAREHEILVVHDNAYSETTYDGYVAPSFLATPGAKEVGVEVFSLSKGFNMTGWRCAAILGNADAVSAYWRLKTNIDSGLFEAVQLAGAAALDGPREPIEEMNEIYARRRDLVVDALRRDRRGRGKAQGNDLRLGPGPRGTHLDVVRRAGARGGGGDHLAGLDVRARPARVSSGSRSPRPTSASPRPSGACASTWAERDGGGAQRVFSGAPLEGRYGYCRAVRDGDRIIGVGDRADLARRRLRPRSRRCRPGDAARSSPTRSSELGAGLGDVVRTRMFVTSAEHSEAVGLVHAEFFGAARPATTMVVVSALLDPRWKVEIEAEAVSPLSL